MREKHYPLVWYVLMKIKAQTSEHEEETGNESYCPFADAGGHSFWTSETGGETEMILLITTLVP